MNGKASLRLTDLPQEILSLIWQHLPYATLRDVRLVCRRLHHAASDAHVLDREVVIFNSSYGSSDRVFQPTLLKSTRPFRHLRLENDRYLSYDPKFWSHVGPGLKSLSFVHCNLSEFGLFAILGHCSWLKRLEVSSCSLKLSAKTAKEKPSKSEQLPNDDGFSLEYLESFCVKGLDSRIFWKILKTSPSLTSLSVKGFVSGMDPFFEKGVDASGCIMAEVTMVDIIHYVEVSGQRLTELELIIDNESNRGTHEVLISSMLSQMDNLRLKKFSSNLDLREDPNNTYMKLFLSKQSDCRCLTLGPLTSDMFGFVCQELPNVEHLDLQNVVFETDSDVKKLTSLKDLVSLRISLLRPHRTRWLQYDMYADLCGEINKTLRVLELPCSRKQILVTSECINSLSRTYPALTHLNLYGCNALNNVSVQTIFRYLLCLESLVLRDCWGLSDLGLRGSSVGDSPDEDTNSLTGYGITRLKRLRLLDLSCCPYITGEAFTYALKLPELRKLFLNHNKIPPKNLMCCFENNPTIEQLEIIGNNYMKITDECVHCIVKCLRYLRYITIGDISDISAECMNLLLRHCRHVVTKTGPVHKD